jgi:hypothetical protein
VYELSQEQPEICEDVIKTVHTRNFAQLYFGRDGYNELESSKYYLCYTEGVQELAFSFGEPVKELRFDPYNGAALIDICELKAVDTNGEEVEVCVAGSNASMVQGTSYVFANDDPNMILSCGKDIVSLKVKMIVKSSVSDVIKKTSVCYENMIQRQTAQNTQLSQEKEACQKQLEQMAEELRQKLVAKESELENKVRELNATIATQQNIINQKDHVISEIYNSRSWRITKIFRRRR